MALQKNYKKTALLASKEEILRDIKYFETRIEEARSQKINSSCFEDDDDSDSDITFSLDMGPSISYLKSEKRHLQTCLQATQELTNLCVLQSEVNVLVNDPTYEREPPVTEQGTWREVTADCRVDLVPFSINFYVHQPNQLFAPTSYRGLHVSPVKAAHENELANSILPRVATPSDAVEVLRGYAVAHRARRTTLARLAEKYSNSLFMEPMADGGYIIKCASLLEVTWTLENKWSPVAPFHHRMKFDLEYMDEAYVKIISQAHRELSDPSLETDERTRLMSKIIATCLEAQGPTQELYESMESDIESDKLRKRRTTLDEENEEPVNKKKKDSEIMAPPKSLPKKIKPKGKENNAGYKKDPKGVKRCVTNDGKDGAKKAKLSHDNLVKNSNVNIKNKVAKEVPALIKATDDKSNNVEDNNYIKINTDKEPIKSISGKEKSVVKSKNLNKDHVVKNIDVNTKNTDKENVVTMKKGSDNKTGNVKSHVGTSKLDGNINTDGNTKNSINKLTNFKKSATSKKNVNGQNLKGKSTNVKEIAGTENTNKASNIKKSNKKLDNIPSQDTEKYSNNVNINKNAKLKKNLKNSDEINSVVSKHMSPQGQNVESSSQNNERARVTNVSSSQVNIASKDDDLKAIAKILNKIKNPKTKSADNGKGNVANVNDCLITDNNTNNKKIFKVKSKENIKSTKPSASNSKNHNIKNNPTVTKNVNNSNEGNVKSNASDKNIQSKSKERLNENIVKNKDVKSNKKDNKQISERENITHVSKENTNDKNVKPNIEKTVNNHDSAITKTKQNTEKVEKNIDTKPKNKDKVLEKNYKTITKENDVGNVDKDINKKVANVNKKLPTDLNEKKMIKTNENADRNLPKEKNTTTKQIVDANNHKLLKPTLNVKSNSQNVIKSITNSKDLKTSKSPIHTNKMKLFNPRNKTSINKLKVTDKQKEKDLHSHNRQKNKILTKIPQKLTSVREKIVKKNPLRISPRKMNSTLKTDSQNSSRNSQRSLQKPMTGIPRLLKKPIR